ncbi:dihydrolipoamide succinyltransferase [Klebsiella michiganensis]|uniref:Dihydrolipoyllysine-residue succinyltransferase component of 2-oxoglutarate dehydrogenase complex n=1 Tax=Klebsiella michiganensis TaxID=1134687 RepID=A0A7H4N419_9ENTR|nr:dihydrolipoamide succinyltransferase [Klebsiella michiganensis]
MANDVVYHNYFDVSMAVSTPRGLVTPVLRDVDLLGMADIEKKIKELAVKGRDGKLTVDDLTGGNFTITNGRRIRFSDVHADHQPAAERDSGHACH